MGGVDGFVVRAWWPLSLFFLDRTERNNMAGVCSPWVVIMAADTGARPFLYILWYEMRARSFNNPHTHTGTSRKWIKYRREGKKTKVSSSSSSGLLLLGCCCSWLLLLYYDWFDSLSSLYSCRRPPSSFFHLMTGSSVIESASTCSS
jgi:hypothetical protein